MAPCENVSISRNIQEISIDSGDSVNLTGDSSTDTTEVNNMNCTFWNSSNETETVSANCSLTVFPTDHLPRHLNEFQIIKAVVLAAVTAVIMFSICRMVFQLFVRYTVRQER